MTKTVFALTLASVALTGCGQSLGVNVKQNWNASVINYGLVPLYPPREDVFVGDIRIHLAKPDDVSLDSRYLTTLGSIKVPQEDGLKLAFRSTSGRRLAAVERNRPAYPKTEDANFPKDGEDPAKALARMETRFIRSTTGDGSSPHKDRGSGVKDRLRIASLPKIDAIRVTDANASWAGVGGVWNWLVSGAVKDKDTVLLSFSGVESVEISDALVAAQFREELTAHLNETEFLTGVCAVAKYWGDKAYDQVRISLVTRAFYARALDYSYGESFGAALRASAAPGASVADTEGAQVKDDPSRALDVAAPTPAGGATPGADLGGGFAYNSRRETSRREVFERPVAFGVEALMIDPSKLRDDFKDDCEKLTTGFVKSGLRDFLNSLRPDI